MPTAAKKTLAISLDCTFTVSGSSLSKWTPQMMATCQIGGGGYHKPFPISIEKFEALLSAVVLSQVGRGGGSCLHSFYDRHFDSKPSQRWSLAILMSKYPPMRPIAIC